MAAVLGMKVSTWQTRSSMFEHDTSSGVLRFCDRSLALTACLRKACLICCAHALDKVDHCTGTVVVLKRLREVPLLVCHVAFAPLRQLWHHLISKSHEVNATSRWTSCGLTITAYCFNLTFA